MFELVAKKEREPGDDLISRLITDNVATGELSRETAARHLVTLLIRACSAATPAITARRWASKLSGRSRRAMP
jgi:cytochrome P450